MIGWVFLTVKFLCIVYFSKFGSVYLYIIIRVICVLRIGYFGKFGPWLVNFKFEPAIILVQEVFSCFCEIQVSTLLQGSSCFLILLPKVIIAILKRSSVLFSVDATKIECAAKYINDSSKGNARMFTRMQDGVPKLVLFANQTIPPKVEIRYNYGAPGLWWRRTLPKHNKPFHWDVSCHFWHYHCF